MMQNLIILGVGWQNQPSEMGIPPVQGSLSSAKPSKIIPGFWNLDVWGCSGGGSICQEEPFLLGSALMAQHWNPSSDGNGPTWGISRAGAQLLAQIKEWNAAFESRFGFIFEGIVVRKVSSISLSTKIPELRPWRGECWIFPWISFGITSVEAHRQTQESVLWNPLIPSSTGTPSWRSRDQTRSRQTNKHPVDSRLLDVCGTKSWLLAGICCLL